MATQYANKNWRVFVRDNQTKEEEEIDRSVTKSELSYLLEKALDWTGKDLNLKSIKLKFKLIIKNKPNDRQELEV